MADRLAVKPEGLLAIRVVRIVEFDHLLDADPSTFFHLETRIANETVAPGLPTRRTAPHFPPVGVIVPHPGRAERLDPGPEGLCAVGPLTGVDHWPGRGRIVAAEAGPKVMNLAAVRVEFHVVAGKEMVVTPATRLVLEAAIELRPR